MIAYVIKRSFLSIIAVLGVLTVIFFTVRIIPGDPAASALGPYATQEQLKNYRERIGLDKPLIVQYRIFIQDLLSGNWGRSYYQRESVVKLLANRLPATLELLITSLGIAIVLSLILGVFAALFVNTIYDRLIVGFSLIGQSIPQFWIGLMLILLFARTLQVLPSFGRGTFSHLILPSITYASILVGVLTRLIRSSMLENMRKDYVRTARAKGLAELWVVVKHALRNSLIPWVTYLGLIIGQAIGGVVVIETVFSWPGVGRLLISSLLNQDFPVVQVTVTLVAASFALINLVVDLVYGVLDPRVTYE